MENRSEATIGVEALSAAEHCRNRPQFEDEKLEWYSELESARREMVGVHLRVNGSAKRRSDAQDTAEGRLGTAMVLCAGRDRSILRYLRHFR